MVDFFSVLCYYGIEEDAKEVLNVTINERIRLVREDQPGKLNQTSFGARINLSQRAVSTMESDGCSVTDRNISSICREFHVREEWLRTGEGEMYEAAAPDDVDAFLRAKGVVGLEADLFKAYLSLPEDLRKAFLDYFTRYFEEKAAEQKLPDAPPGDEAKEAIKDDSQ